GSLLRSDGLAIWSFLCGAKAGIESLLKQSDIADSARVGLRRLFVTNIGGSDDVDLLAHVIEGQKAIEEHEHAVGNLQIDFRGSRYFFDAAHGIIRKKSNSPAGERWQIRQLRRLMVLEQAGGEVEDVALPAFAFAAVINQNFVVAGREHHIGPDSQKGVAADLLSAFDG